MYTIVASNQMIIGEQSIQFPCALMKNPDGKPFVVQINDLVVVNIYGTGMEKMTDAELERNIWAFDSHGNLKWKVSPPTYRPGPCNPYTAVSIQDGKLIAGNWAGCDYEINVTNGEVKRYPEKQGRPW